MNLRADRVSSGGTVTWDSIRADTRAFFSNVFLGGVDDDGDGVISEDETGSAGMFRAAVLGAVLVGIACGLLGAFITLRRMSLFGDMLGHAVLPGVAAGFIVAGRKSTPALLLGALAAGLLAAGFTWSIRRWSRVKEDAALGISLSLFYALGMWFPAWIVKSRLSVEASGLDHYLFGNAAVIDTPDLVFLAAAAALVTIVVTFGYKALLVCTFDGGFARSIGFPVTIVNGVVLLLLTVVVVVSIKIMGVVLVAAMLVIPPATAYLLTDRMYRLCVVSALFGAGAGFGGNYLSAVFPFGSGPAIVCLAFCGLVAVFLVSPRHGVLGRVLRHRRVALRTVRENILAAAYRVLERERSRANELPLEKIAAERDEPLGVTATLARKLRGSGWGIVRGGTLVLTAEGERRARHVVRGHRLWELFLSREASLPPDHVHPAAEEVEHFLGEEAVRELEELLSHPDIDPHGKSIPADTRDPGAERAGGSSS